jgi:SAM-dependent methyltransferase
MSTHAASPAPARLPAALPPDLAPGTNPRGELSCADWRFLLPHLRYDTVLFLGPPAAPALAVFAATARAVTVLARGPAAAAAEAACRERGLRNVRVEEADDPGRLPVADAAFRLVAACGGRDSAVFLRSPGAAAELARVLAPGGTAYLETEGYRDAWRGAGLARRLQAAGFAPPERFWLVRRGGGIHVALPLGDEAAGRYLFERVLSGVSRRARLARSAGALAARAGVLQRLVPDRALVLRRAGGPAGDAHAGPGAYLGALAEHAGVARAGVRPALFARGLYDSNKVAFFLFPEGADAPAALVKITRSPRYNLRLEAEHRALSALAAQGWADAGTFPEALFLDYHDGLAAVGERVVEGAPFRTRSRGAADCPYAASAVEWITRLGERSAPASAPDPEERAALRELVPRLADHYPLTGVELDFLAARLTAVADADGLPSPLRHGDAGTWNVLATGEGRVAFLDWEAARAGGLPLWDLFDFVRSYGSWAARARGAAGGARAFREAFLEGGPLSRLHGEAVARYCGRVGVDRALVEPLFYACWASRAVREAAWSSGPPEEGAYFGLLRLCIRERGARGLRWMLG